MAKGGHRYPQKVCSPLGTGRPAPRAVATLNDRDVVDTVNSTTTVEGPQPLRVRQSSQTGEELHWVDPGECQALRSWPASGVERSRRQRTIDQTSELDLALR